MTAVRQDIKTQIDNEITNKTLVNTITPLMVGTNMKRVIDLLPNLILHYEGDLNSTTIPQFSDGVMNVYRVTENFTYNTIQLKTGNIIGLTNTALVIIADNQKELLQAQLDAINNSSSPGPTNPFVTSSVLNPYIKGILLEQGNGGFTNLPAAAVPDSRITIPSASETTPGIVNISGTQTFYGNKIIKGNGGNTNQSINIFEIRPSNVTTSSGSYMTVAEGGFVNFKTNVFFNAAFNDFAIPSNTNTCRFQRVGDRMYIGNTTLAERTMNIDSATGNVCIGGISSTTNSITNARLEVYSTDKVSVAFPKMTNAQRLAITGTALVKMGAVNVSSGDTLTDANDGIWIYKGATTGWKKLAEV